MTGTEVFKIFPCGANKIPLIKEWQELATDDPVQIQRWQNHFQNRLAFWGVPTGPVNNLLVLDVDVKDANGFETLKSKQLPIADTMFQRTPSGGMHLFFNYPKDGNHYGCKVKFSPGLDIRGAGGYVCYYGADTKQIADAPAALLNDIVRPVYQNNGSIVKVAPEIAHGIITTSLDKIRNAVEGERNDTLNAEAFHIGQLVTSESVTRSHAEEILLKAALDCGMPEYEARATINSALNGGNRKPISVPFASEGPTVHLNIPPPPELPPRWTPKLFTMEDLLNSSNLKKPQLFEDWSTEDITITTADGGTGKTTLKLFEAICLALGERFLGFNCKQQGKTLFITGEDTDKKLAAMLGAIMRQMGLYQPGSDHAEKIQTILNSIVVKKDADLCLISKDRQGFLHPSAASMGKLLEAVEDFKPKMIVFDPISSFWGSESMLNDMNKAVTKFMSELVERSGACVEMINHMGKDSSNKKDMTQFSGRGGTGLPSNARVSRAMRSLSDEEYSELTGENLNQNQTAILCNVNKFTDGSPLLYKPFIIVREGYLFTRKTMTDKKIIEAERSLSDVERVFKFIKECRSHDKYPTKLVIIGHFMACGDAISESKTRRAIELLRFKGHMGESIKEIDNPDQTIKDKAYIIVNSEGQEE